MDFEAKILDIIIKINRLDSNDDYALAKYWNQLTAILSEDEEKTILYLSKCDDAEIILDIASVFEDIAWVLKSSKYIECLERLEQKYPNLKHRVEAAKAYMP